jgi:hypothetical protein
MLAFNCIMCWFFTNGAPFGFSVFKLFGKSFVVWFVIILTDFIVIFNLD